MKRIAPLIVPVLFAVFPLLSLFAENESELELSVLWWPLAFCVAGAAALYGVFARITKRSTNAAVLASLVVLGFLYHEPFAQVYALWVAVLLAACIFVLRTRRELANLALILGVGAAVLALPQAAKVASYQANHASLSASDPRLWPAPLQKPVAPQGARLPDIYLLMPDDYARTDVLKRYFRYDDSAFVNQLKRRGFVLSDQVRSPYSDSESNMAAALNMDYLSSFRRVLGKKSQDVRPVKRVMQDNRAARLLKPLGYRYVHLDTDDVTFAGNNPHISPLATPDSFTNLWMRKSVLRLLGGRFGFNDAATSERYRKSVRSVFSQLARVPRERSPKFVVFHTLLPHDPYVFGARGNSVTFPGHTDESLATKTGRAYYVQQLKFVSHKLLDSVDAILAQSRTRPVILIQADEGFQANDEPFGEAAMKDIRVKGLGAFYLPGRGSPVPQPPNTVNTLRYVFNQYLGTNYKMLRSASYPEADLPYEYKEMRVR